MLATTAIKHHFRYGESIIPNKELNKPDSYRGNWRDGKIHGFGKYKLVCCYTLLSKVEVGRGLMTCLSVSLCT